MSKIFCDNKSYPLDKNTYNIIMKKVEKYRVDFHFHDLEKNINKLNHQYFVTIDKQNKIPAMLILTKIKKIQYSVFVIQGKLYNTKLRFDSSIYDDTLFVGDLVKNKRWFFYINDIVRYGNKNVQKKLFTQRLAIIDSLLKKKYKHDIFLNPVHIQLTGYFLFIYIQLIQKKCKLLFVPQNPKDDLLFYRMPGKSNDDKKIKKNNEGDKKPFIVKKTNKVEIYRIFDPETKEDHGIVGVIGMSSSARLKSLFKTTDELKLNLIWSSYFKSWLLDG